MIPPSPSEIQLILKYARIILSDKEPRTGSELANLLRKYGIDANKKSVNHALFFYGKPTIAYDRERFTYQYLEPSDSIHADNDTLSVATDLADKADTPISDDKEIPSTLNNLRKGMIVRFPVDSSTALSLAECRDFRIGKVISLDNESCEIAVVPGKHDPFAETRIIIDQGFVRRCKLLPNTPILSKTFDGVGTILIACNHSFEPTQAMRYYALVNGGVMRVSEEDVVVEAHAQAPDPQQQLEDYEFHSSIWKSKRDQLLKSFIQLQSATYGIEELVGSRILLLPHQAETVARVLGDRNCRYALADEVGLGKTIEACVILKGLQRRAPNLKALIVVPASLIKQWQNELDNKFWLRFSLATVQNRFEFDPSDPGILISVEDLELYPNLVASLLKRKWDVLIVDEAHRLSYRPAQYEAVLRLSSNIQHCLVLSATPILRYSNEYLSLLRLTNPNQYANVTQEQFGKMLSAQADLRRRLAYIGRGLNADDFDVNEFHEEIDPLLAELPDDKVLSSLVKSVVATDKDGGLRAAQEVHSYLSENYRIENRVIRNRRAGLVDQLSLPDRTLDDSYSYAPTSQERETLAELTEYTIGMLASDAQAAELVRLLCYIGASSPHALSRVIELRRQFIAGQERDNTVSDNVNDLIASVPVFPHESAQLERLDWYLAAWRNVTEAALEANRNGRTPSADSPHRILQVLRAVYKVCIQDKNKLLIFCRWAETRLLVEELLRMHFGSRKFAVFAAAKSAAELQTEVDRFQSDQECQIMISDESGGEGRNFQIADTIIHVDLPWMPAQIEQRIGRVDRVGRQGNVTSIVPYARDSLEADLFSLWHDAFELFTKSMSGMEIILETIQNEIVSALRDNPREGLKKLLGQMSAKAQSLREMIEEERYAEENAAQYYRREEFRRVLDEYKDGEKLKVPLIKWAELAGLPSHSQYERANGVNLTVFDPKQFNPNSIKNAKFVTPPNMGEALRRSGRQRHLVIRGTFDREVAVKREDIVFFAPGELWTDSIINNALYADRGQSCAVMRMVAGLPEDWEGIDCLYSIRVDPRPLYEAGFDPVHLFGAQGYLTLPWHRVAVGLDGQVLKRSNPLWKHIEDCKPTSGDIHLGKRSGSPAPLSLFMERFPQDRWQETVRFSLSKAEELVREEYEFTSELAEEAQSVFDRRISGQRAANQWLRGERSNPEIDEFERISRLLIAGIEQPLFQLESVCFWWLRPLSES